MDTRQELEEKLETTLNEVINEVKMRKGERFDGDLDEAFSLLKEARKLLKNLNDDYYVDDEDSDNDLRKTVRKGKTLDEDDESLLWGDDYDDDY